MIQKIQVLRTHQTHMTHQMFVTHMTHMTQKIHMSHMSHMSHMTHRVCATHQRAKTQFLMQIVMKMSANIWSVFTNCIWEILHTNQTHLHIDMSCSTFCKVHWCHWDFVFCTQKQCLDVHFWGVHAAFFQDESSILTSMMGSWMGLVWTKKNKQKKENILKKQAKRLKIMHQKGKHLC